MAAAGAPAEVLIVDAGSRDGTLEIAAELAERYPLLHTRLLVQDRSQSGFGTALRLGIAYAEGQYCVVLMPDARDPLELIPKMLSELRNGAHLVLCSRFDEGESTLDLPLRFVVYQNIYQRAIRLLLGVEIPDSTYGFRAFNRTFVLALGIAGRRMAVMPEITFKVMLAGGQDRPAPRRAVRADDPAATQVPARARTDGLSLDAHAGLAAPPGHPLVLSRYGRTDQGDLMAGRATSMTLPTWPMRPSSPKDPRPSARLLKHAVAGVGVATAAWSVHRTPPPGYMGLDGAGLTVSPADAGALG